MSSCFEWKKYEKVHCDDGSDEAADQCFNCTDPGLFSCQFRDRQVQKLQGFVWYLLAGLSKLAALVRRENSLQRQFRRACFDLQQLFTPRTLQMPCLWRAGAFVYHQSKLNLVQLCGTQKISLNNPLFKNIPHFGSFWQFIICCICVFVYLCICVFVFLFLCVWHIRI